MPLNTSITVRLDLLQDSLFSFYGLTVSFVSISSVTLLLLARPSTKCYFVGLVVLHSADRPEFSKFSRGLADFFLASFLGFSGFSFF